ncbi:MAG: tyrosine-type recombinase/integrase [Thermoplasmata archaeon]|nr:tyrosine-type recombinase/integrase [Thermoplasmata archaeon]
MLERYRINNLSEQTVTTIKKAITSILKIVGKDRIEDLTIEDIDKYKRYRVENKRIMKDGRELEYSAGVTRRHLGYLKTILKRIGKKELADQIELPRAPDDQDDYVWLTIDEFNKLRDATAKLKERRGGERYSIMCKALLSVGYFGGLRNREARNLKVGDISEIRPGEYQIMVHKGKGNKSAPVIMTEQCYNDLMEWIEIRFTANDPNDNDFIFIG